MRWLRFADRHISHLAAMIAAASLLLASVVHAADIKDLTENMPRGYFGEFRWDDDKVVQNVVIVFEPLRALNAHNAEAYGCGTYEVDREVTKIKVRMLVRLSDLQVEILELAPEGSNSFETGGSHRGKLSQDFQSIDAEWTTTATGKRGELHMRALASATCAPANST